MPTLRMASAAGQGAAGTVFHISDWSFLAPSHSRNTSFNIFPLCSEVPKYFASACWAKGKCCPLMTTLLV